MANAAAKKAAAARVSAGQTYRPIFLAINGIYLVLRYFAYAGDAPFTIWSYVGIILMLLLNVYCFQNIIQSSQVPTKKGSTELAGGIWLDVVAVVWIIQAGTCLVSSKFYYLLLILPPWGAYKVYSTVSGGNMPETAAPAEAPVSEELLEKRQKRSERRRQKRG